MANSKGRISYQGEPGAYGHQACREARPEYEPVPAATFEGAIDLVHQGECDLAMIAVENSTYGRVADVHQLLPESGLHIIGEHFVRVHINLLGVPGARVEDVTRAMSHPVLLGQCRGFLKPLGIERIAGYDTAGSAKHVREANDRSLAALASPLAGEIHGLDVLAAEIEDNKNNTTRFLVMAREPEEQPVDDGHRVMTSFVFRVRNIPAALYKAMGGFATNGVNMVKLESYMVGGSFTATQFFAEVEGHAEEPAVARALEELEYFTTELRILGIYPESVQRFASDDVA
ncbi:prephenate dehydratase [Algicella marina]|uniref:prephenate dehydratase n=1 Tax=Algicella marina TaxID=2683284 RepID=A0A6P1T097_9RHOB|nr:prephenate dehydratase [Algicella marina]QHQ33922.1 prephenate dehydratase [Algicella marina]